MQHSARAQMSRLQFRVWRLVKFAVKPESMRECDPPAVATLTWDVAMPDVQTVKIFVVNKPGGVTLFTHSGSSGTAETGPWVSAGVAFLLKDGDEINNSAN